MKRTGFGRYLLRLLAPMVCSILLVPTCAYASERVDTMVAGMSTEEKVAQMIVPAIRTWEGSDVTNLQEVPALAEALRSRQYGGVILFSNNVASTEQATRLLSDLQANNQSVAATNHIPYFTPVDQEGGSVIRLTEGTRMTGNMAIGATGSNALVNAQVTGDIIGQEIGAMGFNVDFAPSIDVNNNPANPVIGVRSFSDDPNLVANLGDAFAVGLKGNNVIPTYKHYPGHGDTATDTHYGIASVNKTLEELEQCEFVPFKKAIGGGADIIMTAHITYPLVDEQVTLPDGTLGYYPATMSHRMIQEILRDEMGYEGVVITDALEMGALGEVSLVKGTKGTAEYDANVAQQVINAGVDMLLIPHDLNGSDAVAYYDEYVRRIVSKVESGEIAMERINESVSRILEVKERYAILDSDVSGAGTDAKVQNAVQVVGSDEHHDVETTMARQAVTLVKNDGNVLPVSADKSVVVLMPWATDCVGAEYAIADMVKSGLLDSNTAVVNLASQDASGLDGQNPKVVLDYYCDASSGTSTQRYSDGAKSAIAGANYVVVATETTSLGSLSEGSVLDQAVSQIMADAHSAGAKVVHLSDNLPYDVARYTTADAALCVYMSSGVGVDPTERDAQGNRSAYNTNLIAGLQCLFGAFSPKGTLPVGVPALTTSADGSVSASGDMMYSRGHALLYEGDVAAPSPTASSDSTPKVEQSNTTEVDSGPRLLPLVVIGVVSVLALGILFVVLKNRARR